MCVSKKEEILLLESKKRLYNLSKTELETGLSFLSSLIVSSFAIVENRFFFENVPTKLKCTQPNNRLLPRVNQLINKFFKLGLFAVILLIGYRIKTRTTVIVTANPTARTASISSSVPSVAFKPSGHPFSEKRHNTVFVVNPLFDLGMNSLTIRPSNSVIAGSDLVPSQQSYYQIDMSYRRSLLQYRSPYGSIRYYGNAFSCRARLVATVSPQHSIQKTQKAAKYLRLPRSISHEKQNAVQAAILFFEKQAAARHPALDLTFPTITELNDGTIEVKVNGYTSVERYEKTNK